MNRRSFLTAAVAAPFVMRSVAFAEQTKQIPIGDMHFHLFFSGPNTPDIRPLKALMAAGNATLVSWSLVGDMPWIGRATGRLQQKGTPRPGEATRWFRRELARIKEHLASQELKIVLTPADVDRALEGDPHVVLSVEGASFLDDGIEGLKAAYDQGIRQLQLVHYVRNTIGDFQTERPEIKGLSDFGTSVAEECNRLGILIDLAHSSHEAVRRALTVSKVPMVWSHSSVARAGTPNWQSPLWQARQLSIEDAKAIAARGGVIGLWGLKMDVGSTPTAYADRLLEMAEMVGEDHVAFGTDMHAIGPSPIESYADLRRVVAHWERRGVSGTRIQKIAIGNYARVLRQAFAARQA